MWASKNGMFSEALLSRIRVGRKLDQCRFAFNLNDDSDSDAKEDMQCAAAAVTQEPTQESTQPRSHITEHRIGLTVASLIFAGACTNTQRVPWISLDA